MWWGLMHHLCKRNVNMKTVGRYQANLRHSHHVLDIIFPAIYVKTKLNSIWDIAKIIKC